MSRLVGVPTPPSEGEGNHQRAANRALDNALRVLDLFADGPKMLGVTEISRSVGLDKSTISRIVSTLAQHGYLIRSEDGRRYQVGPTAWLVGVRYRLGLLLAETSRVALADVLRRFPGTTGYAGVRHLHDVYYVAVVDGPETQSVHLELGERTPMPRIALGRAMLAHLPPDELSDWLVHLSPKDLPARFSTRGKLLDELDRIRKQGYAVNEADHYPDIGAVAAPVFGGDGGLIGGVAVDFPLRDASPELYAELGPAVIATAGQIQRILTALPL
jgi:IclR family transcriptional regulator, KDG regulon repressor